MVAQPGILEMFMAQLAGFNKSVETAIVPACGTDREVI
jgi:hypothetical protein